MNDHKSMLRLISLLRGILRETENFVPEEPWAKDVVGNMETQARKILADILTNISTDETAGDREVGAILDEFGFTYFDPEHLREIARKMEEDDGA